MAIRPISDIASKIFLEYSKEIVKLCDLKPGNTVKLFVKYETEESWKDDIVLFVERDIYNLYYFNDIYVGSLLEALDMMSTIGSRLFKIRQQENVVKKNNLNLIFTEAEFED